MEFPPDLFDLIERNELLTVDNDPCRTSSALAEEDEALLAPAVILVFVCVVDGSFEVVRPDEANRCAAYCLLLSSSRSLPILLWWLKFGGILPVMTS